MKECEYEIMTWRCCRIDQFLSSLAEHGYIKEQNIEILERVQVIQLKVVKCREVEVGRRGKSILPKVALNYKATG
jgi:hypothetical protein